MRSAKSDPFPGGMERPSCTSCVTHNWACSYSLIRRKPGPRQGSRQIQTVRFQQRLGMSSPSLTMKGKLISSQDRIEKLLPPSPSAGSNQSQELQDFPRTSQPDCNPEPEGSLQTRSPTLPASEMEYQSAALSSHMQQLQLSISWIGNRQPVPPGMGFNSAPATENYVPYGLSLPVRVELELYVRSLHVASCSRLSHDPLPGYPSSSQKSLCPSLCFVQRSFIPNMRQGKSRDTSWMLCFLYQLDFLALPKSFV
jgi:hypothetical protein